MSKALKFLILAISLLTNSPQYTYGQKSLHLSNKDSTSAQTVKSVYHIYANSFLFKIPIAKMEYTLVTDSSKYDIVALIDSENLGKKLYDIKATITSKGQIDQWRTAQYVRRSIKDGYTVFDSINFDQDKKIAYQQVKNSESTLNHYTIALKDEMTYDFLSALELFSDMDLQTLRQKPSQMTILYNRKLLTFDIIYEKQESKKLKKLGRREVHKISIKPQVTTRKMDIRNVTIWLSDDMEQRPLLIDIPMKRLGSIQIYFGGWL